MKKQLNITLNINWIEKLKELSLKKSLSEKKDINIQDLIKTAIIEKYSRELDLSS